MNVVSARDASASGLVAAGGARDLGPIDGTLLAFGGPYGNLQALQAMRRRADALGIPPARCLCTGDVVAYGADPAATVALIRDWGVQVVAGNCEVALAEAAGDCGCGFDSGTACDIDARAWYAYTEQRLDAGQRAWMAGLPGHIRFEFQGRRVVAVHGAYSRINRFVFASTPMAEKRREAVRAGADLVIGGHSGLPFTQQLTDGVVWHNPGAVGLPANDGTPDTWYSLLIPAADNAIAISHHRLAYDHAKAARRMRAGGLPEGYASALETGIWPADDILPDAEKAAGGVPLAAAMFSFGFEAAVAG